jgi:dTDP-4-dehydrorhamnose reductase
MERFLILGSTGQLGSTFMEIFGQNAIAASRSEIDFLKPHELSSKLSQIRPTAVINASAYTQVDLAETERKNASLVNVDSVRELATYCQQARVPLVHFSTDYVFDGKSSSPYSEDAPTGPLNHYGMTKLQGEQEIEKIGGQFLVFRTSWVFSEKGKNFVKTILRLGAERETLKIVSDQIGSPTYTRHLANSTLAALKQARAATSFPSGVYHLCNRGETSWQGFASEICREARENSIPLKVKTVEGIPSSAYPTPAARPKNSRLDCAKFEKIFQITMPTWQIALAECMKGLK